MADQDNDKPSPKPPQKEISMERRLLLAFVLMGLVLFGTQFLYKTPNPQNTVKPVQSATPQQAVKPEPQKEQAQPASLPGQIAAQTAETHVVETNVYRIVFSNKGGVIQSWQLKQYRDGKGKPLELVNSITAAKTQFRYRSYSTLRSRQPT